MKRGIRFTHIFTLMVPLLVCIGASNAVAADDNTTTESELMKAYEIISNSRFVDLTHTFSPSIPVWKGFGQATFARAADPATSDTYTIAEEGFRSQIFTFVGQYGTHIDPPAHFDIDGRTLDEIPVTQMIMPLVVINMVPLLDEDPNAALSVENIKNWEAEHGRVPVGSFVALRTDMSNNWKSNPEDFKSYPFPGWSLPAVKFLIQERGVVAIGHESLDTAADGLKSETWLLQHDHWQIEVMTNLDKVPPTGSLLVATWPKPKSGLGFPARVFAIVPSAE